MDFDKQQSKKLFQKDLKKNEFVVLDTYTQHAQTLRRNPVHAPVYASRLAPRRNPYIVLPRDVSAPHTCNDNMAITAEQMAAMLDTRFEAARAENAQANARLDAKLNTINDQQRLLMTEVEALKRSDARVQEKLGYLESETYMINQRFHDLSSTVNSTTSNDLRSRWDKDTQNDTAAFNDISGLVFVKPKDPAQTISARALATTLGTDRPITPHPTTQNAHLITIGDKGRTGTTAVTNFLNRVKPRVPQTLIVQRAKTPLTLARARAMDPIHEAVKSVITTTPTLAGLKAHRGGNNSSLFLSYHDRNDALNYKKRDAPAYEYPVWQHVQFEATMFNGRGGGFDFSTTVDLSHNTISDTIKALLPKPYDDGVPNNVDMTERDDVRQLGRPRSPTNDTNARNQRRNTGQASSSAAGQGGGGSR